MKSADIGAVVPTQSGGRLSRLARCVALASAIILSTSIIGCSSTDGGATGTTSTLSSLAPGQLIGSPSVFQGYSAVESLAAKSNTIRYRSTSGINGSPTEVSGVMFVPEGEPPADGWPIVSIGHSTSGTASRCAPSANMGLLGNLPSIIPFLAAGYLVVMSDYEGLGTPGRHPYLEPVTAGYNIIDAVRAAREAEPAASDTWLGYGVSQGGQAVWSANELSENYGGGLRLLGSISVAPATDLTPFVDAMVDGTLTEEQITVLPLLLDGVVVAHPDVDPDDYLHGVLEDRADVYDACIGEKAGLQAKIGESVTPDDYRPVDDAAAERLRDALADFSLPGVRAPQPMLVAYGDRDELIVPSWTEAAVRQGCELGGVIDLVVAPGQGHGILNIGPKTVDWVDGRTAGSPPPTTCAP